MEKNSSCGRTSNFVFHWTDEQKEEIRLAQEEVAKRLDAGMEEIRVLTRQMESQREIDRRHQILLEEEDRKNKIERNIIIATTIIVALFLGWVVHIVVQFA